MRVSKNLIDKYKIIRDYIKNYNLFQSYPPTINKSDLKNQILSTRLYFITLILLLIITIKLSTH